VKKAYIEGVESPRTRRWGAGRAAVARLLYEAQEPLTQVDLARAAGVSQPAVSQYLVSLRSRGDATFEHPGWLPVYESLPWAYWSCYSSRFTDQSLWYRIDDVAAQVADIVGKDPGVIVSGDTGADLVRPWRVPSVAVVYSPTIKESMERLGFVPADGVAAASVIVRDAPDNRFRAQAHRVGGVLLAPWLHLVADLLELGGDDRVDGARRFADLGVPARR
jgi:hypothetical protein